MTRARPFIKWVGGKSQLLEQFEKFFPSELRKDKIQHYVEPYFLQSHNNLTLKAPICQT